MFLVRRSKLRTIAMASSGIALLALVAWLSERDQGRSPWSEQSVSGELAVDRIRLISTEQYRNIVRDLFGDIVTVNGVLADRLPREAGLQAVGASQAGISSLGFEAAEEIAREVAAQVVSPAVREQLVSCVPTRDTNAFDRACATRFIARTGRLLYRRALSAEELQRQVRWAEEAASGGDFYSGIAASLANMLVSPNFLFRIEAAEPDPERAGEYRLTGYSKASRLSFLFWNSAPDEGLLSAAERGELHTRHGLQRETDRLLRSMRMAGGLRGFFTDVLALDDFDRLSKDSVIYPKFTLQAAADSREQILRTAEDHLLNRKGDYRALLTTRETFLTPSLAALIGVPLVQEVANAAPDQWSAYTFAERDPRIGLLSQPAFVALHSHPGRTSPTLRGKAIREQFLCQEVPPPPPDVNFDLVQDDSSPEHATMRQRLALHATAPACAGCHKITDPMGLALEAFDGAGSYRTRENDVLIDTRGSIDEREFADAVGLGNALREHPAVVSCLVNRVYAYGAGKAVEAKQREWLKQVREDFAKAGHTWQALLRRLALDKEFYRVAGKIQN